MQRCGICARLCFKEDSLNSNGRELQEIEAKVLMILSAQSWKLAVNCACDLYTFKLRAGRQGYVTVRASACMTSYKVRILLLR